jgi:hypothetical protein
MPRSANTPDDIRAALVSVEDQIHLAAEGSAGGRALGGLQGAALRGSMENLRKVNELPYSLYIFGNVSAERKDELEEDTVIGASEEKGGEKAKSGSFLRISEAIKMASVLHHMYYGGNGRFQEETPWYAPYVRYAVKNGIIQSGEFSDCNEFATRAEMAHIFANCVPRAEFPTINYISDIPDVSENIGYGDNIYLLHRAGVLVKSDKKSNYYPDSLITKTEAAAIIGRIATPSDRKRILNI